MGGESESEKHATEEVYALEHCKETNMLISGGGDDAVSFHVFNGTEYVVEEVVEGLEDSVIFAGFITPARAVAVSMDGCVLYINMVHENGGMSKEVAALSLQIDVSSVAADRERSCLYIGARDGTVGRVHATLDAAERGGESPALRYLGHPSGVLCMEARDNLLFTASHTQVLVFDTESTGIAKRFISQEEAEIRTMAVHPQGKMLGVGYSNGTLLLLSLSGHLHDLQVVHRAKYPGPVETIVFTQETLQYGGFGETLNILHLRDKSETVVPLPEDAACVVAVLPVAEAISIVVMNSGKAFVANSKKLHKIVKEYTFHSCVFCAALAGTVLCGGTQEGVECIDLSK